MGTRKTRPFGVLNKISVTFEGDHILVRSDGEKNYEVVEQIWSKVSRLCEKHRCFNVLGIGDTTRPMEVVEGYEYPGVFHEYGIDQRYRVAWVELNPDAVDVVELTVNILANRDLPGRLFPTVDEARNWLLGSDSR